MQNGSEASLATRDRAPGTTNLLNSIVLTCFCKTFDKNYKLAFLGKKKKRIKKNNNKATKGQHEVHEETFTPNEFENMNQN